MSTEENKATARRFFEEIVNAQQLMARILAAFASNRQSAKPITLAAMKRIRTYNGLRISCG